jgi:NAD(P)-dependent dehydrogenase (short-subunit alcohol dehydrogenase family)
MKIADKAVLVTGANRGIGRALVEEALRRGAKRVYAGTREPLAHSDERVTPLTLDVTDAVQIQGAVERGSTSAQSRLADVVDPYSTQTSSAGSTAGMLGQWST